ncbi:SH3 domain-containing protein [uncultured Oscillibacter sp.]|uniref:SH3 domain-containing protein n=1 Tax=uncultured Oscillibacter sp. TaxID=876091 RepID=UPI00260D2B6A|nr:SH3 domain-containing protein [uncultured Oscillibacter sp.]
MKTRSLAVALSLALMLGMAGCGSQQAQQEPQEPEQGQVQQSEPASTAPPVESMEVKNENDTTKPLTELEDIEPEEADGAGVFEVAGNAESDLEEVDPFTEVNETVYATGTVNLRSGPSTAHDKVGSLNKSDSVTRVGIGTADAEGWSRIQLSDGSLVYVSNKYLSTTKPVVQQQQTSKPSGGQQSKPSGGQQSKPSESTQQQQTQQTETQPSDDGWVDPLQQIKELESQGYTGANVDGTEYSDADKEILGQLLNGG